MTGITTSLPFHFHSLNPLSKDPAKQDRSSSYHHRKQSPGRGTTRSPAGGAGRRGCERARNCSRQEPPEAHTRRPVSRPPAATGPAPSTTHPAPAPARPLPTVQFPPIALGPAAFLPSASLSSRAQAPPPSPTLLVSVPAPVHRGAPSQPHLAPGVGHGPPLPLARAPPVPSLTYWRGTPPLPSPRPEPRPHPLESGPAPPTPETLCSTADVRRAWEPLTQRSGTRLWRP